jgi:hypothetical protein
MNKNIIITAGDNKYYNSLLTLIASIHRESFDLVDQIFVFDLGLDGNERKRVEGLSKVSVVDYPDDVNTNVYDYAFKCYSIFWGQNHGENVFWLDAGAMALKPVDKIFEIIENEGIFLVGDTHLNCNFTHDKCREIMKATDSEMNDNQLSAGILGYKSNGPFQSLINEAYEYSKIKECIGGGEQNHRQDQSIYSILASRYNCNKQDIDMYGYWTDGSRNLNTAKDIGSTIFVHRNGHWDSNGLR